MHKQRLILYTTLVVVGISAAIGFAYLAGKSSSDDAIDHASAEYPLLARRIFLDKPNDTLLNFVPLRKTLDQRLAAINAKHSLYFEYLPTGTTVRNGDTESIVGASLLKLPVVMDLYRAAELGKVNLDTVVEVKPEMLNDQYGDLYKKGAGTKISLREAAAYALEKSDNTAILLVQDNIRGLLEPDETALAAVDADFDIAGSTVLINAKSYSSILKCLYFACYVNRDSSQEILDSLTKTPFGDRITAPIPPDIKVAHKIGVNVDTFSESDCGIFYVPRRPYTLCIMLDLPEEQAKPLLAELSSLVYNAVTSQNTSEKE